MYNTFNNYVQVRLSKIKQFYNTVIYHVVKLVFRLIFAIHSCHYNIIDRIYFLIIIYPFSIEQSVEKELDLMKRTIRKRSRDVYDEMVERFGN